MAAGALAQVHLLGPDEPLSFTHLLIGTVVAADMASFSRSSAHRRAAGLLAGSRASASPVATHQTKDTDPLARLAETTMPAKSEACVSQG